MENQIMHSEVYIHVVFSDEDVELSSSPDN